MTKRMIAEARRGNLTADVQTAGVCEPPKCMKSYGLLGVSLLPRPLRPVLLLTGVIQPTGGGQEGWIPSVTSFSEP